MSISDTNNGVVWITGASSGIGRAVALNLARRGHKVAVSARGEDDLRSLAHEANKVDGSIHPYPLDVTDAGQCVETFERMTADLGPITLAILNAGTHHPVEVEDFSAKDLAKLVNVNLLGTGNCLDPVLKAMIPAGSGHVAIVASVAGYRGLPTSAYYGASKAAQINLAEALKFDLDRHGIKLQLINPGFVRTPLTDKNDFPMPFLMEVDDAAERIVSGLASNAFEITFPRRFAYLLKSLRCLPYGLYFPIVGRMTGK
jgi:short-subunit dehydrogenase